MDSFSFPLRYWFLSLSYPSRFFFYFYFLFYFFFIYLFIFLPSTSFLPSFFAVFIFIPPKVEGRAEKIGARKQRKKKKEKEKRKKKENRLKITTYISFLSPSSPPSLPSSPFSFTLLREIHQQ